MKEIDWLEKGLVHYNNKEYEQAVECFRKGDEAGDSECTEYLGICHQWGYGVESDLHKAAFYNEKAAKAGNPIAMYDTGLNYEYGQGVQQDIKIALQWLQKSAEAKFAPAYTELGNIYNFGSYGIEKDQKKSFEYYEKGAELGENKSKAALADFYIEGKLVEKDLDKARSLYQEAFSNLQEKAVIENDVSAQFWLGTIYSDGLPILNINIDYNQAAEWFQKAAKNNFDYAKNNLGIMYLHGLGVAQNYKKAFELFMEATERQDVAAMSNVANCYYNGKGVEKDYSKAAEYHSKAAHLGYANSQEVLGEMYLKGEGVETNYAKGVYWLKAACKGEERTAFAPLGNCYKKGLGVDKDEMKAFELFKRGTEMGDKRAKISLAECYIEGCGTRYDDKQAFNILTSICNEEDNYRKNLVTVTSRDNEKGTTFYEDPFDDFNLPLYAKAYYLLGKLYYADKGKDGASATKAIAMLRTAEKLGYKDEEMPPKMLIEKIMSETEEAEVKEAMNCFVEVRERNGLKGELYEVVLHHADGDEDVVDFKGRNKFLYIMALMTTRKGKEAGGLTTIHFDLMRERLAQLVQDCKVNVNGYKEWIDEFLYDSQIERDENNRRRICMKRTASKYSNASHGANNVIKTCCWTKDEYEIFRLRSTGGRFAMTTIALEPEQIILPEALLDFMKYLPTKEELENYKVEKVKFVSY